MRPLEARLLLLGSVFVVAACGLVYELVAGAVSSYLIGDPVTQFSLVVGVFLCAMGLGAWLARFVRERLLETFLEVEIVLGLLGGLSSLAMFALHALLPGLFQLLFYLLCIAIGALVGIEIPLLVRLLERGEGVRAALSNVLALDYVGALVGALVFPFLALPLLGLSRSSLAFGLLNLAVAALGIGLLAPRGRRSLALQLLLALALLGTAFVGSTRMVTLFEDLIYQDELIYAHSSQHQRIVLTRWRDDLRLYLNGHLQFASIDEARYHEALVLPAMAAVPRARQVLVLGGGDGLAARRVLEHPGVEQLTLVDLDPEVTRLARTQPALRALNRNSLEHPRLELVHTDAMRFLAEDRRLWDVVIVDLPDPHSPQLAKLYSTAFYALLARRLAAGGVFVTQAGSPYYAPEAYWCIVRSIEATIAEEHPEGPLSTWPYHLNVPSFGEWGFVMASRVELDPQRLEPRIPTQVLTPESLAAMFVFSRDLAPRDVEVNRLDAPVLHRYYNRGWKRFNE